MVAPEAGERARLQGLMRWQKPKDMVNDIVRESSDAVRAAWRPRGFVLLLETIASTWPRLRVI
jgi:hypothetical protein